MGHWRPVSEQRPGAGRRGSAGLSEARSGRGCAGGQGGAGERSAHLRSGRRVVWLVPLSSRLVVPGQGVGSRLRGRVLCQVTGPENGTPVLSAYCRFCLSPPSSVWQQRDVSVAQGAVNSVKGTGYTAPVSRVPQEWSAPMKRSSLDRRHCMELVIEGVGKRQGRFLGWRGFNSVCSWILGLLGPTAGKSSSCAQPSAPITKRPRDRCWNGEGLAASRQSALGARLPAQDFGVYPN